MHAHDLDLPAWGPYSKRYAGCSHIPDLAGGCRLDVSVFPSWDQGRIEVPNIAWDSGYAPWQAAADGSYHAFRHQMLARDELIADVAYAEPGDGGSGRVVRIRLENRTGRGHSLCAHLVLGCQYPSPRPTGHTAPQVAKSLHLILPGGGIWCDARDSLTHTALPDLGRERLVADGWAWHEQLEDGCVGGGFRWFAAGEGATWRLASTVSADARLWIRIRVPQGRATVQLDGREVEIDGSAWRWLSLSWSGCEEINLAHRSGERCEVDALALSAVPPQLAEQSWQPVPAIATGPRADSLVLRYPDLATTYGVCWNDRSFIRQWHSESLDEPMRRGAHNHTSPVMHGPGQGHWLTIRIGPFHIAPGATVETFACIVEGTDAVVRDRLATLDLAQLPAWHSVAESRAWHPRSADERGRAAQLMGATLCTNVVYPVYTRRGYVRHHTPGKAWDSLYTWDSGFIALGLMELDPARAAGCLAQYLMPEGDEACAWLHHGTPLPVQVHAARELWNRTRDRTLLGRLYPGLRQMHRFLAGRHPGSKTLRQSGLLSTWQHFYNSGGWDDYPSQVQVHQQGLTATVAPMVNTCQAIACARILRELAGLLGIDDAAEYDADIASFGAAVQASAWDEAEGWFGYVVHDAAGRATGLLRHASGANANRGLDGCYPLVAGICDAAQERRLLSHLADPRELWTRLGFSTVDQSAPNYRDDGYWNGAVWLPHCWFFWKALLDLGAGDLAWRLVSQALDSWSAEFAAAERTWEKMIIATARGAGWHHFGGLSSPLLCWYEALHRPGRLTGGQGLWIEDEQAEPASYCGRLRLVGAAGRTSVAWLCLPLSRATASWCGHSAPLRRLGGDVWEISLPADGVGELLVR